MNLSFGGPGSCRDSAKLLKVHSVGLAILAGGPTAPAGGPTAQPGRGASPSALLGTVHSDPDGFSRSLSFFEHHKPDLILVEISDFALNFRKERSSGLKELFLERLRSVSRKLGIDFDTALEHAQMASILRQISLPFEYCASSAYAERTGTPLVAVDYSGFSRQWIMTWPEMISTGNIEVLLGMEKRAPPVFSLYARAARRIYGADTFPELPLADALLWQRREKRMAQKIAAALKRFSPKRPVYIGGWWHLSSGGNIKTLRELFGLNETSCLLLDRV